MTYLPNVYNPFKKVDNLLTLVEGRVVLPGNVKHFQLRFKTLVGHRCHRIVSVQLVDEVYRVLCLQCGR